MNIKLIISILVVVVVVGGAWYWYASLLPSNTTKTYENQPGQNAEYETAQISADTTAAISSDFGKVPDDTVVEDSVKLVDNSVSKF